MEKALTGLEVAAEVGDVKSFDMLRAAVADESARAREISLDEEQFQIDDGEWSVPFFRRLRLFMRLSS